MTFTTAISAGLLATACLCAAPALADYTSKLQVGNWSGGAWADNATQEFRNCGMTLNLVGGTSVSVIVLPNLVPVITVQDDRIQAEPQKPMQVRAKFGTGPDLTLNAFALSPRMVQINLPAIPHNYDMIREASRFSVIAGGLNATLNVEGISKVLPQSIDCALRGRATLAKPPVQTIQGVPFEKIEATLQGLAVAERSGIGAYMVFADDKRPGNMQNAAVVAGFAGAQGPGGPANILMTAYFTGPAEASVAEAKKLLMDKVRQTDPKAQFGDLPGIPSKPNSFGIYSLGNNVYEEFYMVQKPGAGFFQFTTGTPEAGRKTAEAAGVKLRQAIQLVVPY